MPEYFFGVLLADTGYYIVDGLSMVVESVPG